MSNHQIEKSIQRGWAQSIMDDAIRTGTRESIALAIYELMAEFELDHRDIRDYAATNEKILRQRAMVRRLM